MVMRGEGTLEVEIKIRVPDLGTIRNRLRDLKAPQVAAVDERDLYYNHPVRDFGHTDEALRLRYSGGEATLTYKGPKKAEYSLKAREEIIVTLAPGERMEEILTRLGFQYVRMVRKQREIYRWEDTLVHLDEVEGLGSFVEIEALGSHSSEERIRRVQETLGIQGDHTPLSYLEMILVKNP